MLSRISLLVVAGVFGVLAAGCTGSNTTTPQREVLTFDYIDNYLVNAGTTTARHRVFNDSVSFTQFWQSEFSIALSPIVPAPGQPDIDFDTKTVFTLIGNDDGITPDAGDIGIFRDAGAVTVEYFDRRAGNGCVVPGLVGYELVLLVTDKVVEAATFIPDTRVVDCDPLGANDLAYVEFFGAVVHDIGGPYELTFNSAESFSEYFSNAFDDTYFPPPGQPDVDFDEFTVTAIGAGTFTTGGYYLNIDHVKLLDDTVEIAYSVTSPGQGCGVTLAFTNPVVLIRYPKHMGDLRYVRTELVADPCPTQ